MILTYQCKSGTHCPTECSWGDTVLFNTSDFNSITIAQMKELTIIRVDTGGAPSLDYVMRSPQVMCRVSNALLTIVGDSQPDKPK